MVSLLLDQVIKLHLQVMGQMLLQVKIHQVHQIAVTYGGILTMVNYISTIMMEAQHNGYLLVQVVRRVQKVKLVEVLPLDR